jgi:hypothetical protein
MIDERGDEDALREGREKGAYSLTLEVSSALLAGQRHASLFASSGGSVASSFASHGLRCGSVLVARCVHFLLQVLRKLLILVV